jgi:hypothetical protein
MDLVPAETVASEIECRHSARIRKLPPAWFLLLAGNEQRRQSLLASGDGALAALIPDDEGAAG